MTTLGFEHPIEYIMKYHNLKEELLTIIGNIKFPVIATICFTNSKLYEDFNDLSITFRNNTPMDERDPLNYIFKLNLEDGTIQTFQVSLSGKLILI
jgi:hypothetical protein